MNDHSSSPQKTLSKRSVSIENKAPDVVAFDPNASASNKTPKKNIKTTTAEKNTHSPSVNSTSQSNSNSNPTLHISNSGGTLRTNTSSGNDSNSNGSPQKSTPSSLILGSPEKESSSNGSPEKESSSSGSPDKKQRDKKISEADLEGFKREDSFAGQFLKSLRDGSAPEILSESDLSNLGFGQAQVDENGGLLDATTSEENNANGNDTRLENPRKEKTSAKRKSSKSRSGKKNEDSVKNPNTSTAQNAINNSGTKVPTSQLESNDDYAYTMLGSTSESARRIHGSRILESATGISENNTSGTLVDAVVQKQRRRRDSDSENSETTVSTHSDAELGYSFHGGKKNKVDNIADSNMKNADGSGSTGSEDGETGCLPSWEALYGGSKKALRKGSSGRGSTSTKKDAKKTPSKDTLASDSESGSGSGDNNGSGGRKFKSRKRRTVLLAGIIAHPVRYLNLDIIIE